MVGKTAPITDRDRVRFRVIKEYIGCIACLLEFDGAGDIALTTIEHVTDRGRRLADEHQATIGLCEWHHQAKPWPGLRPDEMRRVLGPSLAEGRYPFEERYGDEVNVLLPVVDDLIMLLAADPWEEYTIPAQVRHQARHKWRELREKIDSSP